MASSVDPTESAHVPVIVPAVAALPVVINVVCNFVVPTKTSATTLAVAITLPAVIFPVSVILPALTLAVVTTLPVYLAKFPV